MISVPSEIWNYSIFLSTLRDVPIYCWCVAMYELQLTKVINKPLFFNFIHAQYIQLQALFSIQLN